DYTDIKIYFPPESTYLVDILHNEKAIVKLPSDKARLNTRKSGDEFLTTEGSIGDGESDQRLVITAGHKCFINISTR
ncbi:MAG: hypothetical protein PF450_03390, partial [Bacteroidales bacterium]|nr:hypothetical protein [Bacteroidales bacterium]